MLHIRSTKTASGKTAIQIVRYERRKTIVVKHCGSTDEKTELKRLTEEAREWIEKTSEQYSLFPQPETSSIDQLKRYQYIGFRYGLLYESLYELCKRFKFHWIRNKLLLDLVIARIVEPGSKLQSIEFLKDYIGIEHGRREIYRATPKFLAARNTVENKILDIAQKEFNFDFSLVFYDVTTLYFESFQEDELRQCGFSKDNKFNQPQIVLGLLVTNKGFPIGYQIFEGKKFEGHTMLPVIKGFKQKHRIKTFTVVADAAMISAESIKVLRSEKLQYIVGARAANLSLDYIKRISAQLNKQDTKTIRLKTNLGDLVCEFSTRRFAKDNREMEKGIVKANNILNNPGKIKRVKFITSENNTYTLNSSLIEKTELLLGIKGYYTSLSESEASDQLIIEHYHNLWHVEQAFRISKSDLQIRPIFHFKNKTIEAHILICFMALAVCKYIELKTGRSIKSCLKLLKSVTDATLIDTFSGKKFVLRSQINDEIQDLLKSLQIVV